MPMTTPQPTPISPETLIPVMTTQPPVPTTRIIRTAAPVLLIPSRFPTAVTTCPITRTTPTTAITQTAVPVLRTLSRFPTVATTCLITRIIPITLITQTTPIVPTTAPA